MSEFFYYGQMGKIRARLAEEEKIVEGIEKACTDIEKVSGEMDLAMHGLRYKNDMEIFSACSKVRGMFGKVREGYSKLKVAVPEGECDRFYEHWRKTTQELFSHVLLTIWMESGDIARYKTARDILLGSEIDDGFGLKLEDFHVGLMLFNCQMCHYAINILLRGDEFGRFLRIHFLIKSLFVPLVELNYKKENIVEIFEKLLTIHNELEKLSRYTWKS